MPDILKILVDTLILEIYILFDILKPRESFRKLLTRLLAHLVQNCVLSVSQSFAPGPTAACISTSLCKGTAEDSGTAPPWELLPGSAHQLCLCFPDVLPSHS